MKNDWGSLFERFELKTDDTTPVTNMNVYANIIENFSDVDENSPQPKIKFDKNSHNFWRVKQNSRSSAEFIIKNEGNAKLVLRKTKASCGCTAGQPAKMELEPGESTTIKVIYSSGGKVGKQKQNVRIISNDPKQSITYLFVEADIEVPQK